MVILLTGFKAINYTSKSNREVNGCEVYGIIQDSDDDKIIGKPAFIQYISDLKPADLVLDEYYEVVFNIELYNNKPQARCVGLELIEDYQTD